LSKYFVILTFHAPFDMWLFITLCNRVTYPDIWKDFLGKEYTRVYPKVSGLAAWSENCKWYSSLPLSAVVSLFCELV
jgi:hypothetical protein